MPGNEGVPAERGQAEDGDFACQKIVDGTFMSFSRKPQGSAVLIRGIQKYFWILGYSPPHVTLSHI